MANKKNSVERLVGIVRHLRSPEGCPWDRKQTHESLKPMLIEETSELLDAIDQADSSNIKEELGDILMHVVFHSLIAEENGLFSFEDVAEEISDKMQRRHPHIFGNNPKLHEPEQVIKLWQEIKAEEKAKNQSSTPDSLLSRIPRNMPALTRAEMIQKKAEEVGFDWQNEKGVLNKLKEEINELNSAIKSKNIENIEEEIGDILFTIVNLCRFKRLNSAEQLLQRSSDKFTKRFQAVEKFIKKENKTFQDYSPEKLDSLWQKVKKI